MKKKKFFYCMGGAVIGLASCLLIPIIISLIIGDGNFYPVVPALANDFEREIDAVLVQAIAGIFYGVVMVAASFIWEKEEWSILRRTVLHFIVCAVTIFPVAYHMRWMKRSIVGIVIYFAVFSFAYVMFWVIQYMEIKKQIKQLNEKLNDSIT